MSSLAAKAYFVQDSFARLLGVELLSAQDGQACVTFFASSEHCNGLGGVHGAVIFALADIAFAVACNTRGHQAVGIHASIHYIHGARPGQMLATAHEVSCKSRLGHYLVNVTDSQGVLLAQFSGMSYRLTVPAVSC